MRYAPTSCALFIADLRFCFVRTDMLQSTYRAQVFGMLQLRFDGRLVNARIEHLAKVSDDMLLRVEQNGSSTSFSFVGKPTLSLVAPPFSSKGAAALDFTLRPPIAMAHNDGAHFLP